MFIIMEELRWIGLHERKIEETLKNVFLTNFIVDIVKKTREQLPPDATIDKHKV